MVVHRCEQLVFLIRYIDADPLGGHLLGALVADGEEA